MRTVPLLKTIMIAVLFIHASAMVEAAVNPAEFTHKVDVTFTGYDQASTLTDFPALVKLGSNINGFDYADFASASGGDLRITDATGSQELPYEIDYWNTSGDSFVWVKLPSLAGTNTQVSIYYGNPSDPALPAYTTNGTVWSSSHLGVWHLSETGVAASFSDSTTNSNTAVQSRTPAPMAGPIGAARDMVRNEGIETSQVVPISGATPRTVSLWVSYPSGDAMGHIFTFGDPATSSAYSAFINNRNIRFWPGGADEELTDDSLTQGNWTHLVSVYDGIQNTLYLDGAPVHTNTFPQALVAGTAILGYAGPFSRQPYQGAHLWVDEFRVETTARSHDWIHASHANQAPGNSFATYGDAGPASANRPILTTGTADGITTTSATCHGSVISTGAAPTTVILYYGGTDGQSDALTWAQSTNLGVVAGTPPVSLDTALTGLLPETTYYYRYQATNAYGASFPGPSASFTTLSSRPTVDALPVSDVALNSARLNGELSYAGIGSPEVRVYWGAADGGTDPNAWDEVHSFGTVSQPAPVTLDTLATNLEPYTVYHYRFYATNAYGESWASSSEPLLTSDRTDMELVTRSSDWKYLDDGLDAGTEWKETAYDDSTWATGPGSLGFNNDPVTTIQSGYTTYYFRTEFTLPVAADSVSSLELELMRDDGAIVYLNGVEVLRDNMDAGTVDYTTFATSTVGGADETTYFSHSIDAAALVTGTNVIAVEVHQATAGSSDISFDLSLRIASRLPFVQFAAPSFIDRMEISQSWPTMPGAISQNFSGCAVHPLSGEVMIIINSPTLIQSYNPDGSYLRSITLTGFNDTEAVGAADLVNNRFVVCEENPDNITDIRIDLSTASIDKSSGEVYAVQLPSGRYFNKGLEGCTYDSLRGCYYAVQERRSSGVGQMGVYRVSKQGAQTITEELFDAETVFSGLATDLSDAFFDPHSNHLLILSDEGKRLFECTLDGTIVASIPAAYFQPEGVTMTRDGRTLYIASETDSLYRYELAPIQARLNEGVTTNLAVQLSNPWSKDITLAYAITSSDAVYGADYSSTAPTGTLLIAAGDTTASLPLTILNDAETETDEEITITLSGPSNALLGGDVVQVVTIAGSGVELTVSSAFGPVSPSTGVNALTYGYTVNASASTPVNGGGVLGVCKGWAGTGSTPAGGTASTIPSFAITNSSSITWLWDTNYWMGVAIVGQGRVNNANTWYPAQSNAYLQANPAGYFDFGGWSGDVGGADTNAPAITVAVDAPRYLVAHFTAQMSTNQTPTWWLAQYYPTTNDFDAAAMSDTDGDGLAAWEEYGAGTIPTDVLSFPRIAEQSISGDGLSHTLYWDSVSGRYYTVYGSPSMLLPNWTNLYEGSGVDGTQWFSHPIGGKPAYYYRLGVCPE